MRFNQDVCKKQLFTFMRCNKIQAFVIMLFDIICVELVFEVKQTI